MCRIALLLTLLLIVSPAIATAEARFHADALRGYSGYSVEDDAWRLEYSVEGSLPGSTARIGLVAEGDVDGDSYPPWGWIEMRRDGQDVAVRGLELVVDGHIHAFTNLDDTADTRQVYTTWSIGQASLPVFEQLQSARVLRMRVYWEGGQEEFSLKEGSLTGFRQFSKAVLETGYLASIDPDMLAHADTLYHGPTVALRPELTGEGWQQKLEGLSGYAFDADVDTWSYEGLLFSSDDRDELVLGFMFQGPPEGDPYAPWVFAELMRNGQPLYPYQVKLVVDDSAFTYQKVNDEDGYVVWTLGALGSTLLEKLAQMDTMEVKLYHPEGVDSYAFRGSGLVSVRNWATTLHALHVFDIFDDITLMYHDVEHIATFREEAR